MIFLMLKVEMTPAMIAATALAAAAVVTIARRII